MYYLQSRYYDPAIGRFINADTFATTNANGFLSCNMFAYCENNPTNGKDPNGEFINTAIGAVVGAISGAINAYIAGDNPWAGAAIGAATGAIAGAAVDIAIATGGVGAIAIAAIGGGFSSGLNNSLNAVANGKSISAASLVTDVITGAALNALSFGVSIPKKSVTSGMSLLKRVNTNSINSIRDNAMKKVGGQLLKKSNYWGHVTKNVSSSIANAGIISRGAWLISNTVKSWWGGALK